MATIKKGYRITIICIFVFIAGFIIGFYLGFDFTIKKIVSLASGFVHIDESLVKMAMFQYEHKITTCFPNLTNEFQPQVKVLPS